MNAIRQWILFTDKAIDVDCSFFQQVESRGESVHNANRRSKSHQRRSARRPVPFFREKSTSEPVGPLDGADRVRGQIPLRRLKLPRRRQTAASVWLLALGVAVSMPRLSAIRSLEECFPIRSSDAPVSASTCAQSSPSLPSPMTATRSDLADRYAFENSAGSGKRFSEDCVFVRNVLRNGKQILGREV